MNVSDNIPYPFIPLVHDSIYQHLQPTARAQLDELQLLETTDSTNDHLFRLADTQRVIACFTERQTAARGQRGKRWQCAPGGQIYFSLLWPFHRAPGQLMGLSLAVGIATTRALRQYGVEKGLKIKWPNDIYYEHQKLAGILVETAPGTPGVCNAVIGIGINLFLTEEQAAAIEQPWTSLHHILPDYTERNRLAGILLNELLLMLIEFSVHGLAAFQAEWRPLDYLYGQRITVTSPQEVLTGVMQGISANGELLLQDDQQQPHVCLNGSVRLAIL